ncbi:amino acid adenylation domain-containing protein [Streptosporangium sp. NBC_01755]|uniref:non-ribosomal peptide synthetase n=1 Tax=unclassified Streptosporangium TaxID=2632669 RepID=UPI002DDBCEA7|nr:MULTISPECIES: non-ribosomal peptide synthetase [unclassified Streptosporangium]WSA25579.1 amino acid adenylation domain-containing protein [Streptosporangium sp. NBC_01810]WSD03033.1 amino acid adenylation domain-containing protein [Streptosporangium sp. NBC_01755]
MSTDVTKPETSAGAGLLRDRLRSRRAAGREGAIPVMPSDVPPPLSFAQRQLWVLDRLRPGGTDYLVPLVIRLRGDLSGVDLGAALDELVRRHEILRTRYTTEGPDAEPIQTIDPPGKVDLAFDDLTPAEFDALLEAETGTPFDLAAGPMLRARLVRLAPEEHVLVLMLHHIAVDGWSGGLLVRELAALATGEEPPAPGLRYADFAAWQRDQLSGERLERDLGHWAETLRDLPALELPTDRPRPVVWDPAGETVRFDLPAEIGHQVRVLAREHQATPFMVYLAAFWSLLHRYTGQADFAVGSPVAGRTRAQTHDLIGLFANLLVLRADLSGDPTFAELLDRARGTALDAFARQDVPFERVVNALAAGRDLSTHPLVSVNLTLQNNEPLSFEAGAVSGELVPVLARQAKFDLSWTLEERPDGSVAGEATVARALLDPDTARRMAGHYVRLLGAAVADPGTRVSELPLMGAAELDRLVRGPVVPPSSETTGEPCLHERFAARVRERPGAIAVTFDGRHLSYADLEARANRLAHRLAELGVGREDLVGICLPRGVDMLVTVLAVVKAGAAYLPLDPDHPAERIDFLVRDAAASVVVTETALAERVSGRSLYLDDADEIDRIAALPAEAPALRTHPDDLAYVIYTSGSAGRPKGVQVTHANAVRLFTVTEDDYGFGPDDVWALFHSYAFDFSVWEMWGAFLYGGRLVVVPYEVSRSPWDLAVLLADEGVTVLNQTPSAFRSLVDLARRGEAALDRLRLRLVIFGGEALDVGMLEPWWDRYGADRPRLVNMYGITETTVHVTYRPLGPPDLAGERSPIGRPLGDLTLHVLDGRMRPVPVGVPGELHVGGAGVARGYLGRPALTADRFVPDPFGPPGSRLYRSGDRARWRPDGDIGFLGRLDDQVKIRGFRIELGEVEACLSGHPDLDDAVVTVDESVPGERRLIGYAVPRDSARIGAAELRAYAVERLPGHMVPAAFVIVPKLPLTANGKVDLRALPAPDGSRQEQGNGYVPPRTEAETAMAGIWAEVLGIERVGVDDNFFELGGDSIRAVRLVGALRAGGLDYSVQSLFRHQSIADLILGGDGDVTRVERAGTPPFALIGAADRAKVPAGVVDAYPMARVQAGMVYELLADPDGNPYHNITSYLIRDHGVFDAAAFAAATEEVVARHDILRTSFDLAAFSEPLQLVHDRVEVEVGYADLRGESPDEREASMTAFRAAERARLFDLGAAPLLRVHAHQAGDDRWYLSLTECHAILDGWSHNSIITEVLDLYRAIRDGRPTPAEESSAVRYADFIAQERRSLTGQADRVFWRDRLGGANRLTIPAAWADPDGPGAYSTVVPFHDIEAALRRVATSAGTSLKSVLLAAHVAVWRAVAGPGPFYCGLVCNGRTEVEGGDRVRGMFLNPVPFVAPTGAATWRELVEAVFAEEVELWPHRRFPLPEMQREFGDGQRVLDVAFNYLDFHVLDRETVDTSGSTDVSPNEFPLAVMRGAQGLVIATKSSWVGRPYAELLARMYRRALTLMIADLDGDAGVSLLPARERERLLTGGVDRTRAPRPRRGVHELFAEQAARIPDAVAVEAAGATLTYRELRDRAWRWAAGLREAGVRAGDLVGVCLPREPDLVAAVLGVLAVGAAYVPVDPGHPADRIAALVRDAGPRVVVSGTEIAGAVVVTPGRIDHAEPVAEPHRPDPEELVYVVYTSGSTGRPKGVMVRHGALADRVWSMWRNLGLAVHDVAAAVVPMVTDVCQLAVFTTLANGGHLVLAGEDLGRDPVSLAGLLRGSGARFLQASPTTWRMLTESGWSPHAGFRLLSGGEAMSADLMTRLRATDAQVWDMYGPSEATVFAFGTRMTDDEPVWVPAADTTVYLLDRDLEPVLDGVAGEIFVGGDGLARGYLGRPATTADVFLPDPFAAEPGGRMYATGDIGRRDRGGRIEILGRRDHQLKIRGFRVEPGEVENILAGHPDVRAVVVHPVPGPQGDRRLAAYLILRDGAAVEEVRRHADRVLPGYMVPTHFVVLGSFPRLANGKVDRAALPVPGSDRPKVTTRYEPPDGPVETAIAEVWADALGVERVGRDDDYFKLGGHSLLMLRIVARLAREHRVEVTFRDFLEHRTVRGLAAAAATERERPSVLLWLNDRGEGTPLFCVHPGGGSAHWYRHLADVYAPERPLAAFEWPGLHGDHGHATSVPEIAATYLAELRAARPQGPYHILGWCASSGIAWEMARRLHEIGERPRLILIDPFEYASAGVNPLLANLEVLRRAEGLLADLRDGAGGEEARAEIMGVLREVIDDGDLLVDGADLDLGEGWTHWLRSWREMLEARSRYRFAAYPGTVDLIVCEELAAGGYQTILGRSFDDYLDQWRRQAAGVRVHRVPGDHRTALFPPQVSILAAALTAVIDNPEE